MKGYKMLYPNVANEEIEERALEIFNNADVDGNGAIDFGEWCTATINQ